MFVECTQQQNELVLNQKENSEIFNHCEFCIDITMLRIMSHKFQMFWIQKIKVDKNHAGKIVWSNRQQTDQWKWDSTILFKIKRKLWKHCLSPGTEDEDIPTLCSKLNFQKLKTRKSVLFHFHFKLDTICVFMKCVLTNQNAQFCFVVFGVNFNEFAQQNKRKQHCNRNWRIKKTHVQTKQDKGKLKSLNCVFVCFFFWFWIFFVVRLSQTYPCFVSLWWFCVTTETNRDTSLSYNHDEKPNTASTVSNHFQNSFTLRKINEQNNVVL